MKFMMVGVFLAVLPSPSLAQGPRVEGCKIAHAGIYTSESSSPTRDAAGVLHSVVSNNKLALSTTKIPVSPGVEFGIEYVVTGNPDGAKIAVRDDLHYPVPGARPPGATEPLLVASDTDNASINRTFYTSYKLEEPWELLPGKWEFQIWLGDRELCSQEFTLVAQ
jgi:hypothetical protein